MKVHSHAVEAYARTTISPVGGAPRPTPAAADSGSDEAAHVTVSAEARALAAQSAGVDSQKVEALRSQIDSGEYKVNPQMLAMRLLDALG